MGHYSPLPKALPFAGTPWGDFVRDQFIASLHATVRGDAPLQVRCTPKTTHPPAPVPRGRGARR